ncbi:MAG: M3 family oligoendopeptidase [Ruminococcaceae bacterium]|nr:M3 family oligoendopeptidase [Oscillospiraceae bacterium]
MNYTWDLSILYTGFDDPEFSKDIASLENALGEMVKFADSADRLGHRDLLDGYISINEKITSLANKLIIFSNLRYSANTKDTDAASNLGRLMGMLSAIAAPSAKLSKIIAGYDDLEEIISESEKLSEHRYLLLNIKRDSKYLLADGEETVFAKMNISGASAWSDLQSSLTSSVSVDYDGKKIPLSSARNLAYDKDPTVRRNAYEAELKCYDSIKDAVAFALNSIKLQVLSECELRGYESPLAKTLYTSRMRKETLDALISAMEEYMPVFRKYLRAKAKALGHEGGLPWYDLFAPMGKNDKTYTVEDAKNYLLGIFGKFDTELHDMVKCAFENGWIDFYPREGKVGGAFDCGVPSASESRVLTNFDGAFSDIVTLAHELGHSFHDRQVFKNSVLNQDYSMPVAETASTFNEVLVMNEAISAAKDDSEKLALIEGQLMDACQIICDIYSRYTFENSVFESRPGEFMSADRLSELMLAAQKKAYGEGLDESFMHPYMWLCKGHYYSGSLSFYNFPYAFGGLFARGLYSKYKKEGAAFVETYKTMLRTTALSDIEECAAVAGVDLTKREFWCEGLQTIADEIEEFCALVDR